MFLVLNAFDSNHELDGWCHGYVPSTLILFSCVCQTRVQIMFSFKSFISAWLSLCGTMEPKVQTLPIWHSRQAQANTGSLCNIVLFCVPCIWYWCEQYSTCNQHCPSVSLPQKRMLRCGTACCPGRATTSSPSTPILESWVPPPNWTGSCTSTSPSEVLHITHSNSLLLNVQFATFISVSSDILCTFL